MATIGVLAYTLPGLKPKDTFKKMPIANNNIPGLNNQNSIVTKIENIGMIGGEVLVVRKKQMPLMESTATNIQQIVQGPPAKRPKLSTGEEVQVVGGKKSTPQPQSVARRNARERKRVKQVNDGFTALRQHIPEEVASAFEAAGNGRGSAKKLSKVETLRMAVEYIRSLERLLEIDTSDSVCNFDFDSDTVIKTESCSPPLNIGDGQCSESSYDPSADESATTIYYTDTLPDITTLNGQQYLRIPGTNTYQLITSDVFENEENIQPPPPMDITCNGYARAEVITDQHAAIATASTIIAPAPISPPPSSADYNDSGMPPQSISPASSILDHHHHHQQQQQQQQQRDQQRLHDHLLPPVQVHIQGSGGDRCGVRIKSENHSFNIYPSQLAPSSSPINDVDAHTYIDTQLYENGGGMIALKKEINDEDHMVVLDTTGAGLSEESMMDAIDWWQANTPQSDDSAILS